MSLKTQHKQPSKSTLKQQNSLPNVILNHDEKESKEIMAFNNFNIFADQILGSTAISTVYRGERIEADVKKTGSPDRNLCAIKRIFCNDYGTQRAVQTEINLLSKIQHP